MDFKKAITVFQLYLGANNYSDETRKLYDWALAILCDYLQNPELEQVTSDDMIRFWDYLRHDYRPARTNKQPGPLAGRSLENVWTAERCFFGWAVKTRRIASRPDTDIERPRYAEREVQPLSGEEIARLLKAAEFTRIAATTRRTPFVMPRSTARRDVALIMVLVDTGMRVSECARLLRDDVDFDAKSITVRPFGTGRKTKERIIDVGKTTLLAVLEYLVWREERTGKDVEGEDLLFLTMEGRAMNKDSIRQVVNEIGLSAGIEHVHPHRFRHTFASEMAGDDMSEEHLKYLLGQTSDKMARRYVHLHRRKKVKHQSIIDKLKRG